jgi:hypothetical protein
MKRHFLLCSVRTILAAGVLYALPFSHMKWGQAYPGDGQDAFGMIVTFTAIGLAFALFYFVAGGVVQFWLRRRSWRLTALSDTVAFLLLASLLAYGGITAKYTDNGEQDSAANGSQPIRSESNPTSPAAGSRR